MKFTSVFKKVLEGYISFVKELPGALVSNSSPLFPHNQLS